MKKRKEEICLNDKSFVEKREENMEKILVVDDDQNVLKVIKMRLEARDYQVATATEAEQSVEMAKQEVFDLALVDLKLGDRDGITLMEGLQQINPEMPIIIFTAYGTIENAVEAMRKGAYGYLTKPFDYNDLLITSIDQLDYSTHYHYDLLNRLVKTIYPDSVYSGNQYAKRTYSNSTFGASLPDYPYDIPEDNDSLWLTSYYDENKGFFLKIEMK